MKEVLIPVDFSDESKVALEYGIDIANTMQANVRVIHIKTNNLIVPFFTSDKTYDKINPDISAWAKKLHLTYSERYHVTNGRFDYKIREGNVRTEVCNQAKYGDSTLIVLGSHFETSQSTWPGSQAFRLVAHSPCPVLVVNKRMQLNKQINSIALPIDYDIASRKKVAAIAGIACLFKARIHVVGLKSSNLKWMNKRISTFVMQVQQFINKSSKVEVSTEILTGKDYANNLMQYTKAQAIDLITTHVHHTNNPFVRIFQSFTNDLINQSVKPLLIIPTKD